MITDELLEDSRGKIPWNKEVERENEWPVTALW
jgi:hypothetical protein